MHITNKFTVELGQAYSHRSINDYSFAVAGVNCIQHSCMRNEQLFLDTTGVYSIAGFRKIEISFSLLN